MPPPQGVQRSGWWTPGVRRVVPPAVPRDRQRLGAPPGGEHVQHGQEEDGGDGGEVAAVNEELERHKSDKRSNTANTSLWRRY